MVVPQPPSQGLALRAAPAAAWLRRGSSARLWALPPGPGGSEGLSQAQNCREGAGALGLCRSSGSVSLPGSPWGPGTSLHSTSLGRKQVPRKWVLCVPWQAGQTGTWAGPSPACADSLLLSPPRDGMCWEIRQRYLPAQAHGRFLLKGEGCWAAAGGGCRDHGAGTPPHSCPHQGFGTNVLPPSALPVFHLWGGWCYRLVPAGGEQHPVGLHLLWP